MSYAQAFAIAFVGGPVLMLLLTRRAATGMSLVLGGAVIAALVAAALFAWAKPGPEALGMMWLAWVGTVALVVRTALRRVQTRRQEAVTKAVGAMATVIPWVGLAAADWMAG